jgi:hypothetical protein
MEQPRNKYLCAKGADAFSREQDEQVDPALFSARRYGRQLEGLKAKSSTISDIPI